MSFSISHLAKACVILCLFLSLGLVISNLLMLSNRFGEVTSIAVTSTANATDYAAASFVSHVGTLAAQSLFGGLFAGVFRETATVFSSGSAGSALMMLGLAKAPETHELGYKFVAKRAMR